MGQTTVTITAGTPQTVTVNAQARWLEVLNDSPNYLYFQLGPDPPHTLASTGEYANVVKPFGDKAITVPAPNSGKAFDGAVYLYPVAPGGLSTTGQPSNLTTVILVTYTQFEGPPIQIASMPRQMDATSQQRVLAVAPGIGSGNNISGQFNMPASGSSTNLTSFTMAAPLQGTNNGLVFYMYQLVLSTSTNASAAGGIAYTLQLDVQTSPGVSIGGGYPQEFYRDGMFWTAAAGPYGWTRHTPPNPISVTISPVRQLVVIIFKNLASAAAPTVVHYTLCANIDTRNLATSGGGATFQPGPIGTPLTGINPNNPTVPVVF